MITSHALLPPVPPASQTAKKTSRVKDKPSLYNEILSQRKRYKNAQRVIKKKVHPNDS